MTLSTFPTFLTFLAQLFAFRYRPATPGRAWKSRPALAASALGRRRLYGRKATP